MAVSAIRPGIYNVEYFSGSQCSIYIGDTFVDEITGISFQLSQSRTPIFGYASQLFDDVSEGVVTVSGQFAINFKEAGYLWLVLNRYKEVMSGDPSVMKRHLDDVNNSPYSILDKDRVNRQNIEQITNGEVSVFERNRALQGLAASVAEQARTSASLGGYASQARRQAEKTDSSLGSAEGIFEVFENRVWKQMGSELDNSHRRCDDPYLNPFDIYLTFGDFAGTDYDNHTIRRIRDVYIIGNAQQIVANGEPVSEIYSFLARNIV